MSLLFVTLLALQSEQSVDLSRYDPACGVRIEQRNRELRVEWPAGAGSTRSATFNLDPSRPLIAALEADGKTLARDIRPRYTLSTGARIQRPGERYIFFDKPADQKNGNALHTLTLGSNRSCWANLQLWMAGPRCGCRTPLGAAVVPDV